jgi:putative endonuclease
VASRHLQLGRDGEDWAARWYAQHGFDIVARNWRTPSGEIDLVCARGDLMAIVEVATRWSSAQGRPAEAVTAATQRRLRALAAQYLAQDRRGPASLDGQVRFDVVAVVGGTFEVIEGAF